MEYLTPPILSTNRIVVRVPEPGDTEAIREAAYDPQRLNWPGGSPKAQESSAEIAARIADDQAAWALWPTSWLPLTLWEAATGRYLGGLALMNIDWSVPRCEIGYGLRSTADGQGFMTEAVMLLTNYAFDTLSMRRVSIHCDERNLKSIRIPQRLGFLEEGLLRCYSLADDGTPENLRIFALLQEDHARVRLEWNSK